MSANCSRQSTISGSPTTRSSIFTTDNGPNQWSWPDAATTPFRSEKDTNWEGAFRVPAMIRWPGHDQGRRDLQRDHLRARLVPHPARSGRRYKMKDRLLKGWNRGAGKTFRDHLDGYNQLTILTGRSRSPRERVLLFQRRRRMWSRIATTTGRSCFASNASQAASKCGQIR